MSAGTAHAAPAAPAAPAARRIFVPAYATLWPRMLMLHGDLMGYYPFNQPNTRYFYFARIAVFLAVQMLGLEGGEVLVPSYHHGVEIEALIAAGAAVSFYRVGRKWDVDPEDVERHITPRTKALYLTHYAGFPGPAREMRRLADRHGISLIEDCALSLLSSDGNGPLGSTGDAVVFCLYKTLPVPNGGALVMGGPGRPHFLKAPPLTSTASHMASSLLQNMEMRGGVAGQAMRAGVRRLGRSAVEAANIQRVTTGSDHFNLDDAGLSMSAFSRRIAAGQDGDAIVRRRRRNYLILLDRLRDLSPPLFDTLPPGVCPLFYPLAVQDKEPVMRRLAAAGIDTIDLWRHSHPACDLSDFPDAAWLRRSILEIPCHQDITREMAERVAEEVRTALTTR